MKDQLDRIEETLRYVRDRQDAVYEKIGGKVPYSIFIPVILGVVGVGFKLVGAI